MKRFTTIHITTIPIFIAISSILKVFLSITFPTFRLTFFEIPLILLGMISGPLVGGLGGLITDIFNIIMPGNLATSFNLFTIESMVWGIIPGIFLFKGVKSFKAKSVYSVLTIVAVFLSLRAIYNDIENGLLYQTYINIVLVSIAIGGLTFLFFYFEQKLNIRLNIVTISIVILLTSAIALFINTYQLYLWIGDAVYADLPLRIARDIVKLPIQIYLIDTLYQRVILNSRMDEIY
jgi:ECF transporter S component (folate family)